MTREWLAVYSAMLAKPKYRRLSPIGRGALLHVFILAGFQNPEATWTDPEELREGLTMEGFPEGALDELVGLGWLEFEDGTVIIHDWDAHQIAATLEVKRTWEAARKREWRRKKKASPSPAPPTSTRQDITATSQDIGPGHVPDMSRTVGNGDGGEAPEVLRATYEQLYHKPPSTGAWSYLSSLVDRFEPERVDTALRREHARDPNPRTLISRMEKGLETGNQVRRLEAVQ